MSRKLDLALKQEDVQHFKNYAQSRRKGLLLGNEIDPDYELIIKQIGFDASINSQACSSGVARVLQGFIIRDVSHPSWMKIPDQKTYKRIWRLIKMNLEIQYKYNISSAQGYLRAHLDNMLTKLDHVCNATNPVIMRLIQSYLIMEQIVERLPLGYVPGNIRDPDQKMKEVEDIVAKNKNRTEIDSMGMTLVWSRNICFVNIEQKSYILPALAIQEVSNKISDMLSVLTLCQFVQGSYIEETALEDTVEFIRQLLKIHIKRPSVYFTFAGQLEAMVIGELISRHDNWENNEFRDFLKEDLKDEYESCGYEIGEEEEIVYQLVESRSSPFISELSCLSKITGHPLGSVKEGIKKLHGRVNRPKDINLSAVRWTLYSLKEDYLTQYFVHHGSEYPPVEMTESTHPRIATAIKMNKSFNDPTLKSYGPISPEDWDEVTIKQCEELNYLENMLPHLKDKALSVSRSRAVEKYIEKEKVWKKTDRHEMNALLAYLILPEEMIDHVSHVKEFADASSDVTDFMEYLAIRLIGKEKELKTKFRFFGSQTYMSRARNQVILTFAKSYLEKYSSDQALVVSELQLMKKLYVFSKTRFHGGGMTALIICVDILGWNNNFTTTTVAPLMSGVLDKMTDTTLFSKAHAAFENTLFHAESRTENYHWDGQLGGIEGLLQEVWMIVYIQQIKYALRDCPYRFEVLCKGDDVRIRFLVRDIDVKKKGMDIIAEELRESLKVGLAVFGHPVKVLESYASTSVLAFSKKITVNEVAMTSSFRQIQKSYGANNAFLPLLDDYVASAFSNAHSSCSYGINHLGSYGVALFWTYSHLLYESGYQELSDDQLTGLILVPNGLGGFPTIYLHNMFVRSESDLVCACVSLYMWMKDSYPEVAKVMRRFIEFSRDPNPSIILLMDNPYALPVKRPKSPSSLLKEALKKCIRRCTKREEIRDLFSAFSRDFKDAYVETILSGGILDVKLASAIYAASPISIIDQFIQKFANSRSVINFLVASNMRWAQVRNLLRRITETDTRNHTWRIDMAKNGGRNRVEVEIDKYTCPTKLTEDLRNIGWDMKIIGVTHPPIQHQLILFDSLSGTTDQARNHFTYLVHPSVGVDPHLRYPHFSMPQSAPFLGNVTPSGTVGSPVTIDSKNIITKNIKTLLTLLTTVFLEPIENRDAGRITFHDIICHILRFYTKMTPEQLRPFQSSRRSGTRDHHVAMRKYNLQIIPNSVKNMMSMVTAAVNTYQELRLTKDNYRINFLQLMCHASAVIMMDWSFPDTIHNFGEFWGVLNKCPECHLPIQEPNSSFKSKAILHVDPSDFSSLKSDIRDATKLIENYLAEADTKHEYRIITNLTEPPLEDAQRVLAGELSRLMIQHRTTMTYVYNVMVPTASNLSDLAQLKARTDRTRSITGSEIAKIPGSILAEELIPYVVDYTYHIFDLDDQVRISALYQTFDGQMLPWAPFVMQLGKAMKLHSVLSAICNMASLPISAAFSALSNPTQACLFIGRNLSSYQFDTTPEWVMTVRMPAYSPTSAIIGKLESHQSILRHIFAYMHPIEQFIYYDEHTMDIHDDADTVLLDDFLAMLYYPRITVADLKPRLRMSRQKIDVCPYDFQPDEVRSFQDVVVGSRYRRNLLYIWNKNMKWPVDKILKTLEAYINEYGIDEDRPNITMTLHLVDLPSCYSLVRELGETNDADDYEDETELTGTQRVQLWQPNSLKALIPKNRSHMETILVQRMAFDTVIAPPGPNPPYIQQLDVTHVSRFGGYGTTSSCKLYSLLRGTWIWDNRDKISGSFVCLADGEGGDTRFLVENFPNVIVYWNSKVSPESGAPASTVIGGSGPGQPVVHPRVRYYTQKNIGGNLLNPLTLEVMAEEAGSPHLVKFDADLPKDDTRAEMASQLWLNTAKYWLHNSSGRGILIMKVFLDLPRHVAALCGLLRINCEECRLVTIPESHIGYEAYVIAIGKVLLPTLPNRMCQPDATTLKKVERVRYEIEKDLDRHDRRLITNREKECIKKLIIPRVSECTIGEKFHGILNHLSIPENTVTRVGDLIQIFRSLRNWNITLAVTGSVEHMEAGEQLRTLTHKIRVLHQVMKLQGMLWIVEDFSAPTWKACFEGLVAAGIKVRILDDAEHLLKSPDIKTRFPHLNEAKFLDQELYHDTIPLHLRSSLLEGAKLAMELLSSMNRLGYAL